MASLWSRLTGATKPEELKSSGVQSIFTATQLAEFDLGNGLPSRVAQAGYQRNPVVFRCVRMLTEAAVSVPFRVSVDGAESVEHPLVRLLTNPNLRQSGAELYEQLYAHLFTSGNAYLQAVLADGEIKGFYALRPGRTKAEPGGDGWVAAYRYETGPRTIRLDQNTEPVAQILHLKLFNPADDHYGLSPLAAAQVSLETHDAASRWNRALLKNAARPSGALVYSAASGNLTDTQFKRLKEELEAGFQGAINAGRPMVLEGGLDWKSMSMSPRDMDFIEAKHSAARDIALAFGVPPMLLGIPGDNSYANFAEANRAFWRQTIVPLVRRTAETIGRWLDPAVDGELVIAPDLDRIEALAEDRAALWQRVASADFLTDDEKRRLVGLEASE